MPKGGGCLCCGGSKRPDKYTVDDKAKDKEKALKPALKQPDPDGVERRAKETAQGEGSKEGAGARVETKRNPALVWPPRPSTNAANVGDGVVALVVDIGSGMCKAGSSNDREPVARFSSIIGDPRASSHWVTYNANKRASYVGEDAQKRRGILRLRNPIKRGVISSWDDMEEIWQYLFDDVLHMRPKDHPIMMTDPSVDTTSNREKMTQILFEMFNATEIYVAIPPMLSLYATGQTTGVVLDVGEGVSCAVPVHEGYLLKQGIQRANLAGSDVTDLLAKSLVERGDASPTREIVRRIKELLCFVAKDYEQEVKTASSSCSLEESYTLPDGRSIVINQERFRCPELLFQPSLAGSKDLGVHQLIDKSVKSCDANVQKDLYNNVLLSGGTTTLRDFDNRVASELKKLTANANEVRVLAPIEREYSAWLGGAVLASQWEFRKMWISRKDYDEEGMTVVRKKCF